MRIVILDGNSLHGGDVEWDPVTDLGDAILHDHTPATKTVERSRDADILVTNKVALDGSVLAQLPNLKFITVTATGYNVVDIEAATKRGIPVSNVPVYGTDAVAQHVFATLLSFIHRPELHHQAVQNGAWIESEDFSFWLNRIYELNQKTMGIVGFGRIGQATAKLAKAFGMKVVVHSRTERLVDGLEDVSWLSLEELFEASDVISLHCPQTESNIGFVNSKLLSLMKPTSILINTARGTLVNESDLAEALNAGTIGGACLDVVAIEPMVESNPLRNAPRCLITPHNAWAAFEARQRLMHTTRDNIQAFMNGNPIHVVNPGWNEDSADG